MLIPAAARAFSEAFSPPFRTVLLKSIGITLLVLAILWAAGTRALAALAAWFAAAYPVDTPWYYDAFTTAAGILSGLLLFVGLSLLIAPVTSLVAGFFLDEIADTVERTRYPQDPPGRPMPLWPSIAGTLSFTLAVVAVNVLALVLLLVPGVNLVAFFVGNGYLLGREYFQMAASRLMPPDAARALREENGFTVFLGGVVIAGVLSVPVLNFVTPLFATAFMVHVAKALTGSRPAA
ncbi:sulfate transporter family protein [Prosthecomicrobium sp. N25]|uniref:sulfate transporter family protein n=1 Tax=Prosthecomicrobium sp. N25 TaxID=3129254 RepID=UPI00307806A0